MKTDIKLFNLLVYLMVTILAFAIWLNYTNKSLMLVFSIIIGILCFLSFIINLVVNYEEK